jgi:hypothetical protein
MVRRFSSVERRRSAHGVDDVLVEAWKESKPMFAGQPVLDGPEGAARELMSASVPAIIDDGNAAGLPSRQAAALEHDDLKAALNELVGGAHARDAAP